MGENQRQAGHYRLYTYPHPLLKNPIDEERFTKFALVATNDFAGKILPSNLLIPNRFKERRVLSIGGVAAIKTYKDILKKHYKDQMLLIDAGSFLDETKDHDYTQFLRNYLGYDIGALSIKEFQVPPKNSLSFQKYLKRLTSRSQFPLVSSNIFDLKAAEQKTWTGVSTQSIINMKGLKIGFMSVITPESSSKIPDRQITGLYFQNAAKKIIEHATRLRRKGAQVLVLIANGELDCTSMLAHQEKIAEDKVNFQPFESYHCDNENNSFYKVLKQIPAGTVDVIFSSGGKSKVANHILGYPVLQNMGDGKYLSWVEFYYDNKHKSIDKKQTKIYQPIQLCHQFFQSSQDCYAKEDYQEKELIPATFLGEKVVIRPLPKLN